MSRDIKMGRIDNISVTQNISWLKLQISTLYYLRN